LSPWLFNSRLSHIDWILENFTFMKIRNLSGLTEIGLNSSDRFLVENKFAAYHNQKIVH